MAVRRVTYKMVLDEGSARASAQKAASYYQQAFKNVQVGTSGGGASGGAGGAAGGQTGMLAALKGGLVGLGAYVGVRAISDVVKLGNEMSNAAVKATNLQDAFEKAFSLQGVNPDKMLGSLREASQNMASDASLMGQAMKAMRLGVTSDITVMSKLMEMAAKRGQEFGRSTEDAFNDITVGIGRLSPRILDNLGFLVKVDDAYEEYAKTLGIAKSEMTTAEQRQAILNDVMRQAADDGKANVDEYQQMDSAITNTRIAIGKLINERTPWLDFLEKSAKFANDAAEAITNMANSTDLDMLHKTGLELQMIAKYGPGGLVVSQIMAGLGVGPEGAFKDMGFDNYEAMRMARLVDRASPPVESWINPRNRGASAAPAGVPGVYWDPIKGEEITPAEMIKMLGYNPAREQYNPSRPRDFKKAKESVDYFSQAVKSTADTWVSMLGNVPGLMGTSPTTQEQLDDAGLGIGQEFADNYLRRLRDEVLNGNDWEGVDIGEAASALGGASGSPEKILRMFEKAWQDSSLFSDPENLKFIDVAAVQEAMAREADSAKGIENVKAMFGLGDEDEVAALQAVGIEIYNPLAKGLDGKISEDGAKIGEHLMNTVAEGFAKAGEDVPWGGILYDAITSDVIESVLNELASKNEEGV